MLRSARVPGSVLPLSSKVILGQGVPEDGKSAMRGTSRRYGAAPHAKERSRSWLHPPFEQQGDPGTGSSRRRQVNNGSLMLSWNRCHGPE
ncbi:hypothetical protein NDU88_006710 [Pleurodeles waltl]|uniref:Uncharacterized protein n=1 Tax=Pleurodeles waltl TaxID=8319 RepID=A0AAV7MGI9_PLEWA|nr:hypothetical protein NDU88_006710 [Pleurodeles waltl]